MPIPGDMEVEQPKSVDDPNREKWRPERRVDDEAINEADNEAKEWRKLHPWGPKTEAKEEETKGLSDSERKAA